MRFPRFRVTGAAFWLRCSYFWYLAAVGCLLPYITLYYRVLRLDGLQIGLLVAIPPLGVAVLAPVWGGLADRFGAHRLLLRWALVLAASTGLLIGRATGFAALLPLTMLLSVCLAAIPALLDCYAVTISERNGGSYGQLRVWGTLGFMASVWLVGWHMGEQISSFFLAAYAVALLITCGATFGLPALQGCARQPMWRTVAETVRDRSMLLLLLMGVLVMSNATLMGSYFSLYLREIGASVTLVGSTAVVAALSEVPVMIFGRRLLDRFGGRRVLVFAVAMYALRLALYSVPPAPAWVIWIQLLHGSSFGLFLMASVTLVHQLAGGERAATAQGLLSSASQGFGAISGALLGGVLLDQLGAVGVIRVATIGMLAALGFCLFSVRRRAAPRAVPQRVLQLSGE